MTTGWFKDMLSKALRCFAGLWVASVQAELDGLPHPVDSPQQRVAGPDADLLLLFGNGAVIRFGVTSDALALPGHLARIVAGRTGRGVVADVNAVRGTTLARALIRARTLDIDRYDAVIVAFGATDALGLLPAQSWRRDLTALLTLLRTRVADGTALVMLAIPPVQRSASTAGRLGDLVDAHANRLNRVTAAVCDTFTVQFVQAPDAYQADPDASQVVQRYRELAELIAAPLTPLLDDLAGPDAAGTARSIRNRSVDEVDRQASLDALALTRAPNRQIDRLAKLAKETFDTRYAAVTLVDGDRQWNKATVGLQFTEIPRSISLCARAIEHDQALLIEDLQTDPDTPQAVLDGGIRFYAGQPIESPTDNGSARSASSTPDHTNGTRST